MLTEILHPMHSLILFGLLSIIFLGKKGSAIEGFAAPIKSNCPDLTRDTIGSGEVKRPTPTTGFEVIDLTKLVIGYDFRFGKFRTGDFKLLENLSKKYNFSLEEIPPVKEKKQTVSSTLIRELIKEFRFSEIPSYLGREFSLFGKVIHGEHRGNKLGFPTANVKPENTLAIKNGVYVSKLKLAKNTHFGVSNIGIRPTFGENTITVETWIFNFEEKIYGMDLEVIPLYKLRSEKKFKNVEELKKQIKIDIKFASKYLIENGLK